MIARSLVLLALVLACAPAPAEELIAPPPALVLSGVPPIPTSTAARASPYMEFRSAFFLDWHPARREMLVATRFGNVAQVHRVAFPGGARTQLTFYPEPVRAAAWRPPEGAGFVFAKDLGGGEFFQLFWRDAKTGRDRMFTDGRSKNGNALFSNAGRLLAYTSTRRNGKDHDIWLVDPADPEPTERLLLEVEGSFGPEDWSPDDGTLLCQEYISANEQRLWLVDVATGARSLLLGEKGVAHRKARFAKDGKSIFYTTDAGSEFLELRRLALLTRRDTRVLPPFAHDVNDFDLSATHLACVVNVRGAETLHVTDLESPPRRIDLPPGTIGNLAFHRDGRTLGFTLTSARSPSDVHSLDIATGKVERWTESETGGLDASAFVEPEPIRWASFDGLELSGFLYRPHAARFPGRRPVMVVVHGGPEAQSQPGFLGRLNFFIEEMGVAILFPNVRGSSGFGKTFLTLDNGPKREDAVKDIGALLDWIATRPDLDATRVMVRGASYGGYVALACMAHYSDRLRCGMDEVGIANFVTFLERTEAYRRDLRRVEYGDERDPSMRALLERISPVRNAAKIRKPMLVVQGRNDPRVPWTEAEQIVAALRTSKVPVWYVLANDEGHGFAKKANADFLFLVTIRFVEEMLLR